MKLVSRFLVAFLAVSALTLAIYAYLAARREVRELEADLAADMLTLGDGLREGLRAAGGAAEREALLASIQSRRSDVAVRFAPGDAPAEDAVNVIEGGGARAVRVVLPVQTRSGPRGALE